MWGVAVEVHLVKAAPHGLDIHIKVAGQGNGSACVSCALPKFGATEKVNNQQRIRGVNTGTNVEDVSGSNVEQVDRIWPLATPYRILTESLVDCAIEV